MPQDNQSLLAALLGIQPGINSDTQMTPEILEALRQSGMLGLSRDEHTTTKPVGPEGFEVYSPLMGVADMLNSGNRSRAFNYAMRNMPRAGGVGRQPPGQVTPPPPNIIPPNTGGGIDFGGADMADIFSGAPRNRPNQAPGRGAGEITSNGGLTGMMERGLRTTTQAQIGELNPNRDPGWKYIQRDLINRGPTGGQVVSDTASGAATGVTGIGAVAAGALAAENRPGVARLPPSREGTLAPTDRETTTIAENPPPINTPPPTNEASGPATDIIESNERELLGAPNPSGQTTNPGGMPRITEADLEHMITQNLPPTRPYRWGLNEQEDNALGLMTPDRRKSFEDELTYRYTPQITEVPGQGRLWRMPDVNGQPGQTGFIPTPRYGEIEIGGQKLQTVTIFDRLGRSRTYILEPNQTASGTTPGPGDRSPPPDTTSGIGGGTGSRNIADIPIVRQGLDIQTGQAARNETARQFSTGAAGTVNETVETGRIANQTLAVTRMLQTLLEQPDAERIVTGRAGPALLEFFRTANGLLRGAGRTDNLFDESRLSMAEVFNKLNTFLGAAAARQLTNRPTQFDFQAFLAANPGLQTTVTGSRLLAQLIGQWAERDRAIGEFAGRFREENAGTGNQRGFTEGVHRLYDQHMSSFGELLLRTPNIVIPRGTRINGRYFHGQGRMVNGRAIYPPGQSPGDESMWRDEAPRR